MGDLAWWVSGSGFEGDSVSECLELSNVVAFGVFGAGAGVVEVRAEVVEAGLFVAEEMPDDHQHGSTYCDDGFLLAASSSDPSVAFAEEGANLSVLGRPGRCLASLALTSQVSNPAASNR